MFISTDFIYNVYKIIIRRIPGTLTSVTPLTDHRLLKFSVKLSDAKTGPGYWKLNTSFEKIMNTRSESSILLTIYKIMGVKLIHGRLKK